MIGKSNKLKVGVIFGGKSAEREVSLATGRYVFNLLDSERFEGVPLYMDSKGQVWKIPIKLVLMNTTKDVDKRLKKDAKKLELEELPKKIDFMFIALLGKYGEDGAIQGVFELLKIPYSGSGILASAVGMHKRTHKDLIKSEGFLVAKDVSVVRKDFSKRKTNIFKKVKDKLGYPVIVKPVMEGSSIGVSFVKSQTELEKACEEAFKWDDEILIEEFIKGQEFMCVVLGNDDPVAMPPSEVEFTGDIFTYDSKYMPGEARYYTPIRATEKMISEIQKSAVAIYKLIGIKGYGRVDGFLVDKEKIYISEPHTGTIMVPSSYVFQQAALQEVMTKTKAGTKAGTKLNPRRLITTIIDLGVDIHAKKIGTL
jgi:D-alanine-D-alanine ligase